VTLLNAAAVGLPLTIFISVRTSQHNADRARRFRAVVEGIPGVQDLSAGFVMEEIHCTTALPI
jgi:Lrp/AsnC family transcriptional regulator